MKKYLAVALAFALPLIALADEHLPGTVAGENIALAELNHAMAGSILGHPIYASFSEATFTARLTLRSHETDVTMEIADDAAGTYRGSMTEMATAPDGSEIRRTTSIEFVRLERLEGRTDVRIHMKLNDQAAVATVVGESFANGHFAAPTFTIEGMGEAPVSFRFSGQACYGYSVNIAMLMTAAYQHLRAQGL